ncbi:hypothetical protein DP23_4318 [Ralstonia pickettii]|nr:hypothetical protein DP23_4318 [Ralstonia pickettii]
MLLTYVIFNKTAEFILVGVRTCGQRKSEILLDGGGFNSRSGQKLHQNAVKAI